MAFRGLKGLPVPSMAFKESSKAFNQSLRSSHVTTVPSRRSALVLLAEGLPAPSPQNCEIVRVIMIINVFLILYHNACRPLFHSQLVLNLHCHFQLCGDHLRLSVHYTTSNCDHLTYLGQSGTISAHLEPSHYLLENLRPLRQSLSFEGRPQWGLPTGTSCNNSDSTYLSYPHWLQE